MKTFVRKTLRFFLVVVLACLGVICVAVLGVGLYRLATAPDPHSPEALLKKADDMAWLNNWIAAEPLYRQTELTFVQQHKAAKALYAHVSQIPATSGTSDIPTLIWTLTQYLTKPEAQDPETRLRILMIRGMVETNYDAAIARTTWVMVEDLAKLRIPGHVDEGFRQNLNKDSGDVNEGFREKVN